MGNVKFPSLMLTAELSRLSEYFLYHSVVSFVPVDFGLHHQNWNVLVQSLVILLKGLVYSFVVTSDSSVLNCLSFFAQGVDMFGCQIFEFAVSLFFGSLIKNEIFKELEVLLTQALVGQVGVFSKNVGGKVIVLVLAVK